MIYRLTNKAYLSAMTVTNISGSFFNFTYKMAAKISWHRCGTKLRHFHPMLINDESVRGLQVTWSKHSVNGCRISPWTHLSFVSVPTSPLYRWTVRIASILSVCLWSGCNALLAHEQWRWCFFSVFQRKIVDCFRLTLVPFESRTIWQLFIWSTMAGYDHESSGFSVDLSHCLTMVH